MIYTLEALDTLGRAWYTLTEVSTSVEYTFPVLPGLTYATDLRTLPGFGAMPERHVWVAGTDIPTNVATTVLADQYSGFSSETHIATWTSGEVTALTQMGEGCVE